MDPDPPLPISLSPPYTSPSLPLSPACLYSLTEVCPLEGMKELSTEQQGVETDSDNETMRETERDREREREGLFHV